MLKAAIEKIASLASPSSMEVNGKVFCDRPLHQIEPEKKKPKMLSVTGLDSICKLIRNEKARISEKIFVEVDGSRHVTVYTTFDEDYERDVMYSCEADTPKITLNCFMSQENAIIQLQSLFIPSDDTKYLLELLGSICKESKVTSTDNGVTQNVTATSGVAMKKNVNVRPIVNLKPFRTFLEVKQPESRFLLRIDDEGRIGLFDADGGVWKLDARRSIAAYFEKELADLIKSGKVVVIR